MEKTVAAHHHCLRSPLSQEPHVNRTTVEEQHQAADELIAARQKNSIFTERTERRFADVATLKNKGLSISSICRELGLVRNTVRRFYRAADVTELLGAPRAGCPHLLDEFSEYLHARFNDGQISASVLYEELRRMGYRGNYTTVRDYVRLLRQAGAAPIRKSMPKVRQITSWMLRRPAT